MVEYPRVAWDLDAYHRRVRAACFVCETVAGGRGYAHHVAYRGGGAVAFLSAMPLMVGHLLVAPVAHREQVVGDFPVDEYLGLQRVVHAAGTALAGVVPTERLYVFSLGSQQGNRHVHWHLTALPPGVPYADQQVAALTVERGYLDVPDATMADLAARVGARMRGLLGP